MIRTHKLHTTKTITLSVYFSEVKICFRTFLSFSSTFNFLIFSFSDLASCFSMICTNPLTDSCKYARVRDLMKKRIATAHRSLMAFSVQKKSCLIAWGQDPVL